MILYKLYTDNRKESVNKGKWYARAKHLGTIDTEGLISEIEKICTVSDADVVAVLKALVFVMNSKLQESYKVKLDGLGTFSIGIKTIPADTDYEFSAVKNIVGAKVNFLAEGHKDEVGGPVRRQFLKGLHYSAYIPASKPDEDEPEP